MFAALILLPLAQQEPLLEQRWEFPLLGRSVVEQRWLDPEVGLVRRRALDQHGMEVDVDQLRRTEHRLRQEQNGKLLMPHCKEQQLT